MSRLHFFSFVVFLALGTVLQAAEIPLDQSPAKSEEWGYHPVDGKTVSLSPPSFTWKPTKNIVRWELAISSESDQTVYETADIEFNVHTPTKTFLPGKYAWKYRGFDTKGNSTAWGQTRTFTIPDGVKSMPLPPKNDLFAKIPKEHPRIFVRPEGIERLRQLAKSSLADEYKALAKRCEQLLKNPPDTTEPPVYDAGRRVEAELDKWWGNRVKTIAVLENAALLAFVYNLDGNEQYAELAKKLLLDAAKWDPKGATGYRYNDEAGMPFAYHFARTYSFLNAKLSDEEKQICRDMMKIRGEEMYKHLCPRQLWEPYESHANRAWHFLGELGLVFYGEIPEAADWLWFAMNRFYAVYPVWCDDDGGWHEGISYWNSYQGRFCWWADIIRTAFDINAFDKPYYSQIGFFPIYLMPPGKIGGGFADLCNETPSRSCLELMDIVAMQSGNPYWRWYVDAHDNFRAPATYYTFLRKAAALENKPVVAQSPTDLPTARHFRGIGLAAMNTDLTDAAKNVQLLFKSAPAPFGAHSHGYDANNSYIFSAWNENLLINSGRRDFYGSPHHRDWMWSTRSQNNITVDGIGQLKRSRDAVGEIKQFETTAEYDLVVGEASQGYVAEKGNADYPNGKVLKQYTRSIVFLKPDLLIIYDQLQAVKPATFEYWLHAKNPFQPLDTYFPNGSSASNDGALKKFQKERFHEKPQEAVGAADLVDPIVDQHNIAVRVDKVAARLDILLPENLSFTQTNQYDPTPQPKIKVREWHLTAKMPEKTERAEFLMVVRPWKVADAQKVPNVELGVSREGTDLLLKTKGQDNERTIRISADGMIEMYY